MIENVLAKQKIREEVKWEAFPFQPIAHFASMGHSRHLIWEEGAYYSRLVSPSSTLSTSASTSTLGALFGEEGAYSYYPPLVQHRHHHEHCHHCNDRHFEEKMKRGDVLVLPAPPRLSMFNIIIVTNIVIIVLIIIFILTFFNQIERVNLENKKV